MTVQLAYNGHDTDCLCTKCLMADLDATIVANGGTEALERINSEMQLIGGGNVDPERMRYMKPGQRTGRGVVRRLSQKQQNAIIYLLRIKDTSKINIFPGQTLNPDKVHTMGLQAARGLIDKLHNAPDKPNAPVRMATINQKNYITNLNNQLIDPRLKITETDIKGRTTAIFSVVTITVMA